MSGQSTSPNGSFSNVAAGCSLRESSQRDRPLNQEAGGSGSGGSNNQGESSSSAQPRGGRNGMFDAGPNNGGGDREADESDVEMMDDDHPRRGRSQAGDDSSQEIPAFGHGGNGGGGPAAAGHDRPPQAAAAAPSYSSAGGATSGGIPTGQFSYDPYGDRSHRGSGIGVGGGPGANAFRRPREFSTSPGMPGTAGATSSAYCPGELTVYSWGRGEDGQLGIGDTSDQDTPTYVDSLRGVGVKQIACGSGHTVVLTGEG